VQNVSIQKASELPPNVRSAVEQLLGRPIDPDEEVSIAALPQRHIASSQDRTDVAGKLEALLNQRAAKVSDISDEEIDAAADESVQRVRHRRE
jgi:hypothetical protein